MEPIYVTGHKNPDTDSIVAAIAYASLRNALGDREYTAACLGRVSDETQIVLNHFGFPSPQLITNVYTQVRDLGFDRPPILSPAVTVERAWNELQERKEFHRHYDRRLPESGCSLGTDLQVIDHTPARFQLVTD